MWEDWWQRIKRTTSGLFQTAEGSDDKQKLGILQWAIIIVGVGISLMILHQFVYGNNDVQQESHPGTPTATESRENAEEALTRSSGNSELLLEEYEVHYQRQLENMLRELDGVGDVSVMVNLDKSEQIVLQTDQSVQETLTTETDHEGGVREIEERVKDEQVVIVRDGDNEKPIILHRERPTVRGVLVMAEGAEHMQVKVWISEAVQRVLDVPAHRVSVLPKKN